MGFAGWDKCTATGIEFRSNSMEGIDFGIDATTQPHTYKVIWKLTLKVTDKKGNPLSERIVSIADKNNNDVSSKETDQNGSLEIELPEYTISDSGTSYQSPYKIRINRKEESIHLDKDRVVTIVSN